MTINFILKHRFAFLLFLSMTIILVSLASASSTNGTSWIDDDDEPHLSLNWEDHRRGLAQKTKYVSYSALKKNSVPCNKKGSSYYNCNSRQKANPYKRGCSKITNCYRYTNI
ncbi:hypothetical protein QQ045_008077 [Rhodiola kirilowii]